MNRLRERHDEITVPRPTVTSLYVILDSDVKVQRSRLRVPTGGWSERMLMRTRLGKWRPNPYAGRGLRRGSAGALMTASQSNLGKSLMRFAQMLRFAPVLHYDKNWRAGCTLVQHGIPNSLRGGAFNRETTKLQESGGDGRDRFPACFGVIDTGGRGTIDSTRTLRNGSHFDVAAIRQFCVGSILYDQRRWHFESRRHLFHQRFPV